MRVLIYSHDTYGLGHLRRSLAIADDLTRSRLDASVLIVTGSPRAGAFRLPPRCENVVLPAVLKQADGRYAARDLAMSLEEIVALRSNMIVRAYRAFAPDVVLVDHAPCGMCGELGDVLAEIRRSARRPALVLGMRDIVDDAEVVEESWRRDGVFEAIQRDYDRILVYGSSACTTTAVELGLDQLRDAAGTVRLRHVGYLATAMPPRVAGGRLLVTTGGGGDGHRLLRRFVGFLESGGLVPMGVDVVIGPFLSERRRSRLHARMQALEASCDIRVHDFVDDMRSRIASAAGVIGMAGYNTIVEILASATPALVVPRERPRREQLIRAQRLAPLCGLEVRRADELDHASFAGFIAGIGHGATLDPRALDLRGLERTTAELIALAARAAPPEVAPIRAAVSESRP